MRDRLEQLTELEIRDYFRHHLGSSIKRESRGSGEVLALCPFHEDRRPSFSLNYKKGAWKCHAGCGEGGLVEFESRVAGATRQDAVKAILEIVGIHDEVVVGKKTIYDYHNERGEVLYQVVRDDYPDGSKRISQRKSATEWNIRGIKPVLYHLPEVLQSENVIITEGEKDCERIRALGIANLAVTTNSGGAGKWRDDYALVIGQRPTVVFADADEVGRSHAATVVHSLYPRSRKVKLLEIPGYHDVGDYLEQHGKDELVELMKNAEWYMPEDRRLFVTGDVLSQSAVSAPDWAVENLIEVNSNGFFSAKPKAGKSFLALHLALHLATGRDWLGYRVTTRLRTGFVAREDSPGRTAWRLKRMMQGMGIESAGEQLWMNTQRQAKTLFVDNKGDRKMLIENIRDHGIQFCILDVFNRLHHVDENDNTAMRRLMDNIEEIRQETGAGLLLLHHRPKYTEQEGMGEELSGLLRGAGAIAGFAEFIGAIDVVDYASQLRMLRWQSKDAAGGEKKFFTISEAENGIVIGLKEGETGESIQQPKRKIRDGKLAAIGGYDE